LKHFNFSFQHRTDFDEVSSSTLENEQFHNQLCIDNMNEFFVENTQEEVVFENENEVITMTN